MVSVEESPDIPSKRFLEKKKREKFFYFEKIHYYKNISQYRQILFFWLDRGSAYVNICTYHVYHILARPLTVGGKNTSRKKNVLKFFCC